MDVGCSGYDLFHGIRLEGLRQLRGNSSDEDQSRISPTSTKMTDFVFFEKVKITERNV
jgi:hypothetical protein